MNEFLWTILAFLGLPFAVIIFVTALCGFLVYSLWIMSMFSKFVNYIIARFEGK